MTSGWLPEGEYQLIEQSVNGQYVLDGTPHLFTITAGQTNKAYFDNPIENVPMRRIGIDKFELWKVNGADDLVLRQADVAFKIYAEDPTANPAPAGRCRDQRLRNQIHRLSCAGRLLDRGDCTRGLSRGLRYTDGPLRFK